MAGPVFRAPSHEPSWKRKNHQRAKRLRRVKDFSMDNALSSNRKKELFELLLKDSGIALPPRTVIPNRDASKPCPATVSQEQLWNASRYGQGRESYNEVILLRLSEPFSVTALIQALNDVIQRHEILRTRFAEVDEHVYLYPVPQVNLEVLLTDLSRMPASEREAEWRRLSQEEASRVFNPELVPLIRSCIIALSPSEQLLLVTLHRIVCDRWSRKILINEIRRFYESYIVEDRSVLRELEIQYCDFAVWQRQTMKARGLDQAAESRRMNLRGEVLTARPDADPIRLTVAGPKRASCKVGLCDAAGQQVMQISRTQRMTASMILLAGWHVLLSQYSGQQEVAVCTEVANRVLAELQMLIGPVSSTRLIKVNLKSNPSFREVMGRVKELVIQALDHQELPFGLAWAEVTEARDSGRDRFADVMFVMDERIEEEQEFGRLNASEERLEGNVTLSDLAMVMWQIGEGFEGKIEYTLALFDAECITRMAAAYQRLMEVILWDLDCRVRDLPPLTD
jgi:condensation domain-containing protein